jgi:ribose-phosphate pyrophosphokinase
LKIHACCTHPVLSGPSIERIESSPIDSLVVTNTIPLNGTSSGCKKVQVLSVAELLGETIKRIYESHSVSTLFV